MHRAIFDQEYIEGPWKGKRFRQRTRFGDPDKAQEFLDTIHFRIVRSEEYDFMYIGGWVEEIKED